MKQNIHQILDLDTSVATEGLRQAQVINEQPFKQELYDAWLEEFLANAKKSFNLPVASKDNVAGLIQVLEQSGYFGFAHYLAMRAKPEFERAPEPSLAIQA